MNLLLVMAGGALGAGARHLAGAAALRWLGAGFPWGTLAVNLLGGLLMGALTGAVARVGAGAEPWRLFLGVGVLGGFTTFSSFSLDAVVLWQRGAAGPAATYVLGSVAGALAMLAAGLWLARATLGRPA